MRGRTTIGACNWQMTGHERGQRSGHWPRLYRFSGRRRPIEGASSPTASRPPRSTQARHGRPSRLSFTQPIGEGPAQSNRSGRCSQPEAAICRREASMAAKRINRAIELLEQGQAIYYTGAHTGHVLTHTQGKEDAQTWADYINVGMEHGAFDMAGLAEYMRGLVDGGPTRSGHRTPTIVVEAPVNGTDAVGVASNTWQFRQILARGVHGLLLCQAEQEAAVRAFVEAARYPQHAAGVDP